MEREQASSPQLCETGCGFFANVGCGGLCSKCHRELARAAAAAQPKPTVEQSFAKPVQEAQPVSEPVSLPASAPAEASTSGSADAPPKTATRCLECKKKVGLTGFKCKCGNMYCGQHRYAESHNCPFDYKGVHKEKLASSNPVVQASKVQKI
ncbi:hypothetical protein PLESTB_001369400 [Pleodorina starrii]|uniref:Uncharacterized protein n=1 Tax=Pleodorina starrii TaxID=330485 RepID=A0A9W6F7G7_9CHLO|nr:hypothetical protein PLESTM_000415600 [Pleodorina starrii]GLC58516.1 hypothetical protein PLESTB_001369400 [Pleodorina starrii]GLC74169.1 hypothetical protein PLESTF_001469300 [Pleodorina starrii]